MNIKKSSVAIRKTRVEDKGAFFRIFAKRGTREFVHCYLFGLMNFDQAKRLATRIRNSGQINLEHWEVVNNS